MRQCNNCVVKHLSACLVLDEEVHLGHPDHVYYIIGHLNEAAIECENVGIAVEIRKLREAYRVDYDLDHAVVVSLLRRIDEDVQS